MNPDPDLPADVIEAIRDNRKIEAIKRLRTHSGCGLKEAKHAVEGYISKHWQMLGLPDPEASGSMERLIKIVIFLGAVFAVYRYFVA